MPKKKEEAKPETAVVSVENTEPIVQAIVVAVRRAHCLTPHSIELRKDENGNVVDGRTEDWNHIYTVGAKTIEHLFAEAGHPIPANDADELEMVFSPFTGELIAIRPKRVEPAPAIAQPVSPANPEAAGDGAAKTE